MTFIYVAPLSVLFHNKELGGMKAMGEKKAFENF
jgi:hypothetical protein